MLHTIALRIFGQLLVGLIFKKDASAQVILFFEIVILQLVWIMLSNFLTVESEKYVESID